MESLKVLNISAAHPHRRAGIVAYDFHKNLQENGCDSRLLTLAYEKSGEDGIISYRKGKYDQILKRSYFQLVRKKESLKESDTEYYFNHVDLSQTPNSTKSLLARLDGFQPDIIVVHFAQDFLTTQNLKELNEITGAPIYWFLMDMKPMTGGCAYAWDCVGYQSQCGNCPAIYSNEEKDLSYKNLQFNIKNIAQTNLTVLIASKLTEQQVQKSTVFKDKAVHKLYIAINSKVFRPLQESERNIFAEQHKLDASKKHLFFGAVFPDQKRKGFKELMESLTILEASLSEEKKKNCHLLIAGLENEAINTALKKLKFNCTYLGFLDHESLAKAFAFSNVFLCPTLQDAGPMMVNQSLMAGTPVISFKMGVSIDFVSKEKGTGDIIEMGDVNAFASGVKGMLEKSAAEEIEIRKQCRAIAVENYSYESQFKTFKEIVSLTYSSYNYS